MYASGTDRPWKGVPKELDEAEWSEVSESSDEEMTDRSTGAERRRARKAYVSSWPGHPMDVDKATLRKGQMEDESLSKCWRKAKKGDKEFHIEDGLLWWVTTDKLDDELLQLCVLLSYRSLVLSLGHRPGPQGRDQTVRHVMDEFYWPGVYDEISKLYRACLECQRASKHHLPPAPLQPLPIIDTLFKRIGMDLTELLPTTAEENRFILVIMDYATRWPEAIALRSTESTTIADQLMILFNRTGIPEEILTDCGRNLISRLMTELYKLLGVKGIKTTSYHPASDGLVERFN